MTDIARLGMAVDTSGLQDGQRELRNLVSTGADAEKEIEGQTKRKSASWGRMAAKAGLALGAIGTGVTLAVRGQLNEIDRLAKSAQKIGIPVEHLSQLQHAAELSGVSMAEMETGLRRLSQNMAQDADKFEALGIAVRDANGEMRPTVEVMDDLADVIAEMPDGAEKTALMMDMMGRSGSNMIPLLNGGSDAIKRMREEADQLGLTISQDTAEAAEAFNDNITRITGAGRGFWRMITAELAPTLEKFSGILVDLVNRFGDMSPRMKSIFSNGALMLAIMTPLVAVVGALVGAVALIGAPLLIGAAAFAAIGAAVIAFWDDIKALGAGIMEFATAARDGFLEFYDAAVEHIGGAVEWVKDKFNGLVEWFAELPARLAQVGRDIIGGLWQGIKDGIAEFDPIGAMKELGGNMLRGIGDRIGWNSPATEFIRMGGDIVEGLAIGINSTGSLAVNAMQNLGDQVTSGAWDMAKGVVDAMGQMFQGSKPIAAAQALINTFQGITEALKTKDYFGAAKIAAQGFAAVASIRSARPGGSGGGGGAASGGGGSSGAAAQAPNPPTQTVIIDAPGMDVSSLVKMLNDASKQGHQLQVQQA